MSFTLIIGPMMAGKTVELVKRTSTFKSVTNSKALFILPTIDTRDIDKYISSHFKFFNSLEDVFDVIRVETLESVNIENYQMICIDECQFFKNIHPILKKWLLQGKHIVAAGLAADYKMQPFGEMSELISLASEIVHLKASCKKCFQENKSHTPACYTRKLNTSNSLLIEIGDDDLYESVCFKHY